MTLQPGQLVGTKIVDGSATYEFTAQIGAGGFAYVYSAEKRGSLAPHKVAIKVLNEKYAFDSKWRDDFKKEATAHQRVSSSPQVASLHNFIDGDQNPNIGLHMMVMEWVDGKHLDEWLNGQKVKFKHKLDVSIQLCQGLMTIHGNNQGNLKGHLAHGDITPRNILITPDNEVKIIDFGLAWDIREDRVEIQKKRAGTISYLAPEQLSNPDGYSLHADIFSLGAVFYLLFSGNHYHQELKNAEKNWKATSGITQSRTEFKPFWEMMQNYRPEEFDISDCENSLTKMINNIVLNMLLPDPEERKTQVQSIKAVKQELDSIKSNFIKMSTGTKSSGGTNSYIEPIDRNKNRFSILIARQYDNKLIDELLPLQPTQYQGRDYYLSSYLQSVEVNQIVYGILFNAENQIVDKASFQTEQDEFYFYVDVTNITHTKLMMNNGKRLNEDPAGPFALELIIQKDNPIDILLILDRSISYSKMNEHVLPFIEKLSSQLDVSARPYEFKCIFYGEYKTHPYNKPWTVNFEVELENTPTLKQLREYVEYHYKKQVKLDEKSFSGALELALLKAANGSVSWRKGVPSYVVIIGSSPPHPTPLQQLEYSISDFSTSEFRVSEDWIYLVDYMRKQKIRFSHLWIPFTNLQDLPITAPAEIMNYINTFGEYMNSDNQAHILEENEFSLNRESNRIVSEILSLQPCKLSKTCFLPIATPLTLEGDNTL